MPDWVQSYVLTFVPLFIVIDALGIVPLVFALTDRVSAKERRKVIHVSAVTAAAVGFVFLLFGQFILRVMGIPVGAIAVSGGAILLVFSIKYMVTGHVVDAAREEMVAVVPIGTPLLAGPATITTLLLLVNQYPLYVVSISFALNVLVAWGLFLLGERIMGFMGKGGLQAVSSVFNLLLAAIAVTMIFRGLHLLGVIPVAP